MILRVLAMFGDQVLGEDELLSGELVFRNMSTGEELQLSTDHVVEEFCSMAL